MSEQILDPIDGKLGHEVFQGIPLEDLGHVVETIVLTTTGETEKPFFVRILEELARRFDFIVVKRTEE